MVHIRTRRNPGQKPLLDACTTSRPPLATAVHLSRRGDRDRRIGFGDVAVLPDPEWATAERAGRFEVAGLVPGGQAALVPVPLTPPAPVQDADPQPIAALLDDAQTVMHNRGIAFEADLAEDRNLSNARCTVIAAAAWIDDAAGLALADDCAAVLDAVAARPELRHNHALLMSLAPVVAMLKGADVPETTHAERWAAQHRTNDAVDVLGVGDVVITYDPEHPYLGSQGTVTAVDGTAVTVQFTDHDVRTLLASELVLSVRVAAMLKGSVA